MLGPQVGYSILWCSIESTRVLAALGYLQVRLPRARVSVTLYVEIIQ